MVDTAVLGVELLVQEMTAGHDAQSAVFWSGLGACEYALGELEYGILGVLVLVPACQRL